MSSWLVDYVDYTKEQESPEIFHIWTGIATIGAAMGRKVYLNRRQGGVTRYVVYPGQLMVILVGGSGRVRKSTALLQTKKFLKHINKPLISGKTSVEAFLDQLDPKKGGNPHAMLLETELTGFISKASYLDPMLEVLLKLADAEDEFPFHTRGGGKIIIPEPCLTVLACSTPESLGERLPTAAQGAGLFSRIITPFAKDTDRELSLTDVEDEDIDTIRAAEIREREKRLLDGIFHISERMAGPMTYTKDGRKWADKYYHFWINSPIGQGEGYGAKKMDHLLRVAMCLAASEHKMVIEDYHLKSGQRLLEKVEKTFDKVYAYVGTTYTKDRQRIVDFIATKGGEVTAKELYAGLYSFFKDRETFTRTLALLKEAGVLDSKFTTQHPPMEIWSLAGVTFKI